MASSKKGQPRYENGRPLLLNLYGGPKEVYSRMNDLYRDAINRQSEKGKAHIASMLGRDADEIYNDISYRQFRELKPVLRVRLDDFLGEPDSGTPEEKEVWDYVFEEDTLSVLRRRLHIHAELLHTCNHR